MNAVTTVKGLGDGVQCCTPVPSRHVFPKSQITPTEFQRVAKMSIDYPVALDQGQFFISL